MRSLLYILFGVFTLIVKPVFAQHHEDEPEGVLLILEGVDAITKKECKLYVMDTGYRNDVQTAENFFAVVKTNYEHDSQDAGEMTVRLNPKNNNALISDSQPDNQIAIFLEPGHQLDLRKAKSFNLKWLHGNHFHTNRCLQLRIHEY